MKKIIILETSGRLANQLWHFAAVYAFCLEQGFTAENRAFFRYCRYFGITVPGQFFGWIFGKFYYWHGNVKLAKLMYLFYAKFVKIFNYRHIVNDGGREFLLPPTLNLVTEQNKILNSLKTDGATWYFCGWLFRNPAGLEKYHDEICNYLKPLDSYLVPVREKMAKIRSAHKFIVGVHIRQGDYKTWDGGKYFYTFVEVRKILDDYIIQQKKFKSDDIAFVICSDEIVDLDAFGGLNIYRGHGGEVEDLHTLAESDLIIGSTSTYGAWAAYYGKVPFVRFSREKINWPVI